MNYAYRLFRCVDKTPTTLFHGVEGTRAIAFNHLYRANVKLVRDGGTGTQYLSGFHVLATHDECREYRKKFKNPEALIIARVYYIGEPRKKEHSRADVLLLDNMMLTAADWHQALCNRD